MTGFDIAVLLAIGLGAVFGLLRGFVHEVLAILAWVAAALAIRYGHAELSGMLRPVIGTGSGAAVAAFAILLLVPYFVVRLIARRVGSASRASVLGPVDRVLGLGFGALKGTIIIVLVFSVAMLGYDTIWGAGGRPAAITEARSYPFVNAASNELVTMLAARRRAAAGVDADAGTTPGTR
jgi:membrane protein required for colicin V production